MKIALLVALLCHALIAANGDVASTSAQPTSRIVTVPAAANNGTSVSRQSPNKTGSAVPHTTIRSQDSKIDTSTQELRQLQAQLASTKKELEVQTHLVAEKNSETVEADRQALTLRKQEEELKKQSEVAETFAKEKSQAAGRLQKELEAASVKARDSLLEKQETEKFLDQTEREEVDLEKRLSAMKAMLQSQVRLPPAAAKSKGETKVTAASGVSQSRAASGQTAGAQAQRPVTQLRLSEHAAPRNRETGIQKQEQDNDAVQKLIAENEKLKSENEKLKRQVSEKNTAEEKQRLRRRLKSKLVEADHRLHKR